MGGVTLNEDVIVAALNRIAQALEARNEDLGDVAKFFIVRHGERAVIARNEEEVVLAKVELLLTEIEEMSRGKTISGIHLTSLRMVEQGQWDEATTNYVWQVIPTNLRPPRTLKQIEDAMSNRATDLLRAQP